MQTGSILEEEDFHSFPLTPTTMTGNRTKHTRKRSKFYKQKPQRKEAEDFLTKMLLDDDFNDEVIPSDDTPLQNEENNTPLSTNPQRYRSDNEYISKLGITFQDNLLQQEYRQSIIELDKQILQEQVKRYKVEKTLRNVDEENQKLRTMINHLLNVEFKLS